MKHFRKRFKALQNNRQHEAVSTDFTSRTLKILFGVSILLSLLVAAKQCQYLFSTFLPSNKDGAISNAPSYSKSDGAVGIGVHSWNRIPTLESRDHYEKFRKKTAMIVNRTTGELRPQPRLLYKGTDGLGHRLVRMAAVYHSTRILQFPHLHVIWGPTDCGKSDEGISKIFDNLFGFGPMVTESEANAWNGTGSAIPPTEYPGMLQVTTDDGMQIVNAPPGYRVWKLKAVRKHINEHLLLEKAISDEQFYRQLRTLFRFNDRVRGFTEQHSFSERLVFGVHIRAGNGETGDFAWKRRGFYDIDAWIANTTISLTRLASKMGVHRSHSLPPLVFVATDDQSVIGKLANSFKPYGFSTVSFPQHRFEDVDIGFLNKTTFTNNTCHNSWVAQFIDMILLGASDAVIAGRYSSFTQALPLITVLSDSITTKPPDYILDHQNTTANAHAREDDDEKYSHRLFCESSILGDKLDCFDDYFEWLWSFDTITKEYVGNQTIEMVYAKEIFVPR